MGIQCDIVRKEKFKDESDMKSYSMIIKKEKSEKTIEIEGNNVGVKNISENNEVINISELNKKKVVVPNEVYKTFQESSKKM